MARIIEDKEKISFGNKLKEIREIFGMSRDVFARELKVDATYYTRVEEGAILPDYLFLKKLIHTYRISSHYLFDFQEEPEKDK
jgi:transcriptional regulator with XRE-family HTH domain